MAWVRIDEEFYDHPRWAEAPGDSIALWLAAMAWCNRNDSIHGFIPAAKTSGLVNVRNVKRTCADLVERGAFEPTAGGYIIHDYEDYQQPEKVKEIREKKVAAGKAGAKARWHPNGIAGAIADGMADAIANEWPVPVPVPVPVALENSNRSSSSTRVSATDDDDFHAAVELIVDAKLAGRTMRTPNAYRRTTTANTLHEDGDRVRRYLARGFPSEVVAAMVLDGEDTGGDPPVRARHDPACPLCDGYGWRPDAIDDYGEPAPGSRSIRCDCTEPDCIPASVTDITTRSRTA